MQIYDSMDIAEWYTITTATDCLQPEDGNCAPADFPPADFPLADVPPALVQKPASDMTRSNMDNDENPEKGEHGWENSDRQIYGIMDIAEWYPITTDCLQPEKGNCLSQAVCDDSVALMPLIQINRALFFDGGDTAGGSGHDRDDGGSPAGLLGYLPRCTGRGVYTG